MAESTNPVSLRQFVQEMDTFGDECHAYLNRRTGEFFSTMPGDLSAAEDEDDDDLPDWQREQLPKVREVLSSEDWLALPSKFDFDEYRIMRDFCATLGDTTLAQDLYDTIGGRGTFGRFKGMIDRHNLLDAWYRFREEAFTEIAKRWLEVNGIPYRE